MTDDLESRLDNWGAWSRWRQRLGQAESFEGAYRSPQHWDQATTPPPDVNRQDALEVENAVGALRIFHHFLLKAWYVNQWPESRCIYRALVAAGMQDVRDRHRHFLLAMAVAKAELVKALAMPAVIRKDRARSMVRRALGLAPLLPLTSPTVGD